MKLTRHGLKGVFPGNSARRLLGLLNDAGVDALRQSLTGFVAAFAGFGQRYIWIDAGGQSFALTGIAVVNPPVPASRFHK